MYSHVASYLSQDAVEKRDVERGLEDGRAYRGV